MRKPLLTLTLFAALAALLCNCNNDVYRGNWRSISTLNAKGRANASAFIIGNNAYLVGGYGFYHYVPTYFNSTWAFDIEDYSWRECDTLPGPPRRAGAAFALNGKGYYCGGIGIDGEYYSDMFEFDPTKDAGSQWTKLEADPFPEGGFYDAVSFTIDEKGYVGTGLRMTSGTSANYYRFDPSKAAGSRWTKLNTDGISKARYGGCAFVIGSKAYIIGGRANNYRVASFECYDASTDEFSVISNDLIADYNINLLYRYNASSFSIGNDGYVTCGVKFTGEVLRDTWRFTPDGDKGHWQLIGDFEGPSRHSATSFAVGRYGFLLCGQNGNFSDSFKDDVWIFSPDEKYNKLPSR